MYPVVQRQKLGPYVKHLNLFSEGDVLEAVGFFSGTASQHTSPASPGFLGRGPKPPPKDDAPRLRVALPRCRAAAPELAGGAAAPIICVTGLAGASGTSPSALKNSRGTSWNIVEPKHPVRKQARPKATSAMACTALYFGSFPASTGRDNFLQRWFQLVSLSRPDQ